MKCALHDEINHSDIRKQFRETLVYCPLFEREGVGMASTGVLCAACHLRISQLLEAKNDLILRSVVSVEDYKRNPDAIQEHLPESLGEYYAALRRLGKSIADASAECGRCKPEPIGERPVKAAQKTEMTQCGRGDLR